MARVPFGYRQAGDGWAIDADQAAVVVRIFAEFTALYAHAGLTESTAGLNVDACRSSDDKHPARPGRAGAHRAAGASRSSRSD